MLNVRLINAVQLNLTSLLAPVIMLPVKFSFAVHFYTVGKENKHDSCLTLERLQMTAAVLHDFADRVTKGRK